MMFLIMSNFLCRIIRRRFTISSSALVKRVFKSYVFLNSKLKFGSSLIKNFNLGYMVSIFSSNQVKILCVVSYF